MAKQTEKKEKKPETRKFCDVKNREVITKEDCKDCEQKENKVMVLKFCKHKHTIKTCPHCNKEIK
jgi:hypothetical protein